MTVRRTCSLANRPSTDCGECGSLMVRTWPRERLGGELALSAVLYSLEAPSPRLGGGLGLSAVLDSLEPPSSPRGAKEKSSTREESLEHRREETSTSDSRLARPRHRLDAPTEHLLKEEEERKRARRQRSLGDVGHSRQT